MPYRLGEDAVASAETVRPLAWTVSNRGCATELGPAFERTERRSASSPVAGVTHRDVVALAGERIIASRR